MKSLPSIFKENLDYYKFHNMILIIKEEIVRKSFYGNIYFVSLNLFYLFEILVKLIHEISLKFIFIGVRMKYSFCFVCNFM